MDLMRLPPADVTFSAPPILPLGTKVMIDGFIYSLIRTSGHQQVFERADRQHLLALAWNQYVHLWNHQNLRVIPSGGALHASKLRVADVPFEFFSPKTQQAIIRKHYYCMAIDKALIEKLSKVITKRFIKFLDEEATNRPDAYAEFYTEFGIFLKEGAAMDFTHKDGLVKLLRFESSLTEKGKTTSLADYVTRMTGDHREIYYLVGPNRAAIENGPYLEAFKARNLEVLFCYEAVDEYVMNNVREFDGKKLTAADHADVKLSDLPKPEGALSDADVKTLTKWMKDTLDQRVAEVKASDRLVDSPVLALNADARTAIVALTHDPKLDDMALLEALKSPAFYVGALGSRANTAKRKERLRQYFDLSQEELDRLHGPVGLRIGSRTPAEIAVSILAEMTAVRHGVQSQNTGHKPITVAGETCSTP